MRNVFVATAVNRLTNFLADSIKRSIEPVRAARTLAALLIAGTNKSTNTLSQAVNFITHCQRPDGGWSDPEETALAVSVMINDNNSSFARRQAGIRWLNNARLPSGGWGRHSRDQARIPTTALICFLAPDAVKTEDINWLKSEWDYDFNGPVRLSYKAGFFLLAMPDKEDDELVVRTIAHLSQDQNEDGGFAPWKGHPIGSEAWSTGVVLWGLSRWINFVEPLVIERALNWLEKAQLPTGYWPYHYLDEGAAYALIGSVSAMKALVSRESKCARS